MPLNIRGTEYLIPGENDTPRPTGREIIEIEEFFGLDGITLLGSLFTANPPVGYTKIKALLAMAWIAMNRTDNKIGLAELADEYGFDEIIPVTTPDPTDAA